MTVHPAVEIGSDFELLDGFEGGDGIDLEGAALTFSGRQALRLIADDLVSRGFRALLTANHYCHSMVDPFVQSGLTVITVSTDQECLMDPSALSRLLDATHPPAAILHCDTFGSTASPALRKVISRASDAGSKIVVDSTHSFLSNPTPSPDYVAASFRKLLHIPDGAAAWGLSSDANLRPSNGRVVELRRTAALHKREYLRNRRPTKDHLALFRESEQYFDAAILPEAISASSARVLKTIDVGKVVTVRRRNANRLLANLDRLAIEVVNRRAVNGSPAFVVVRHRDVYALRDYMASRGVYCPVHWPPPPSFTPGSHWRSDMLSLPVDHRYSEADMDFIANCLDDAIAKGAK